MKFNFKQQDKNQMQMIRVCLGFLCILLPFLSVLPGFLAYEANGSEFWYSISATFYATSGPHMVALLKMTALFFLCYKGYTLKERILTLVIAITANNIADFPCLCAASEALEKVGPWQIALEKSSMVHNVSAGILFACFYILLRFGFTQTDKTKKPTRDKIYRNRVYRICALLILAGMTSQVITSILGIRMATIINEAVMLIAFGFAFLVKSGLIIKLNDRAN